jgi:hypothetical protein
VRDVAVAGDLVGGVDHHDALAQVVGQDAGRLAQHGGLADARASHDQDALPGLHEVIDDLDGAVHGPPDAAGQPDDLAGPVPDRADPVERPLDACAVVVPEQADVLHHVGDVRLGDLALQERHLAVGEPRLRPPPKVDHDLDEVLLRAGAPPGGPPGRRSIRADGVQGSRGPPT